MTTPERLTAIEESISRLLALMGSTNNRLEALEGDKQPEGPEDVHVMDAQIGDYVGNHGFYITDIEHGESATLCVQVNWDNFLEAAQPGIKRYPS